tara:strand:- start:134 stop:970 length:837 start_codon:yes stop_codon:yes gene_type:complete
MVKRSKKIKNDSIIAKMLSQSTQKDLEYYEDDLGNDSLMQWEDGYSYQIMMKWEKPYMEACIDELKPTGDVLEIGFGMAYSATQIQKYKPKSHTIIECNPTVIEKAKKWAEGYPDSDIRIVEGTWQEKTETLGVFDQIFFDDYAVEGLYPGDYDSKIDGTFDKYIYNFVSRNNWYIFFDMVTKFHMKVGSRFTYYQPGPWSSEKKEFWKTNYKNRKMYKNVINNPLIDYYEKTITLKNPASSNCDYFTGKEVIIGMVTKSKENNQVRLIDATLDVQEI